MAGFCECGDEPSFSIKCGVFLSSLGRVSFSGRALQLWRGSFKWDLARH
jgi:hypothetical protein